MNGWPMGTSATVAVVLALGALGGIVACGSAKSGLNCLTADGGMTFGAALPVQDSTVGPNYAGVHAFLQSGDGISLVLTALMGINRARYALLTGQQVHAPPCIYDIVLSDAANASDFGVTSINYHIWTDP